MKQFSNQLKHAQIYVSQKKAEEMAIHLITAKDRYTKDIIAPTPFYKLIQVMLTEVDE